MTLKNFRYKFDDLLNFVVLQLICSCFVIDYFFSINVIMLYFIFLFLSHIHILCGQYNLIIQYFLIAII
jgi:hypothetical protein